MVVTHTKSFLTWTCIKIKSFASPSLAYSKLNKLTFMGGRKAGKKKKEAKKQAKEDAASELQRKEEESKLARITELSNNYSLMEIEERGLGK